MAKVLHITQYLSPGGLERMIWSLSADLIKKGHTSEVFVYDQEGEKTLLPELRAAGIRVHVHQKEKGFSWSTVKALRKLIKKEKYTAIHSHDLGAQIYASFANFLLPTKHIHTQHSFIHLKKSWLQALYERLFYLFPDSIVTVAPHQIEDYKELGLNAETIPNGVVYPEVDPALINITERRSAVLKKSHFDQKGIFGDIPKLDSCWLLFPGRIQKSKGQTKIFTILQSLSAEELSRVHFIIIGAPTIEEDRLELETLYHMKTIFKSSVSYLGFQPNPLEWMSASNGVMLLSEFEGFPLVPLESLGLGIPTLLSNIPPHLTLKNKASLTPLDNLEMAIQWVKERLKIPTGKLERYWNENADFRNSHSIDQMTSEYLALYEKK